MRTRGRLLQVIDKADNGPIVTEAEFDREWIRKPIAGLVKKYDITWPKDTLVPADDALADRVFLAGLELARETGVWCIDTSRRMVFSQRELDEVIEASPSQVVIGEGADTVPMHARRPDENSRVATVGGAYGIPVPENQFTAIMLSYAQEPLIDFIDNASLTSTYGRPIRAGSPLEALACWQECDLSFEAIRRAGRPGMPIGCAENSPSAIGELSSTSYGGFRPTDWHHACFISELKTNYAELTKATHYARTGSHVHTFYNPIYGGYAGGGDGMAVVIVAGMILLQACYHAVTVNPGPSHPFLSCDTHPLMIPSIAVALQGLNRNTHLLTTSFVRPVGGPGTKDILYETAALTLASVPSGIALMEGVQSATGRFVAHCSGLEARFMAQVTHAAEKLTRKDAEPLVQALVAKYKDGMKAMPTGQPFDQVYDLTTVQPLPAWQQTYEEVCQEIEALGLPL